MRAGLDFDPYVASLLGPTHRTALSAPHFDPVMLYAIPAAAPSIATRSEYWRVQSCEHIARQRYCHLETTELSTVSTTAPTIKKRLPYFCVHWPFYCGLSVNEFGQRRGLRLD